MLLNDKDFAKQMGNEGRKFVIENYSTEAIGKQLEEIIDEMDFTEWDFDFSEKPRNPDYDPPQINSDSDWLVDIYKNILMMDVDPSMDHGHKHWMSQIKKGLSRPEVLKYFKNVASKENAKINSEINFNRTGIYPNPTKDFIEFKNIKR